MNRTDSDNIDENHNPLIHLTDDDEEVKLGSIWN